MLDFFDDLLLRNKFIDIDFENPPFPFVSEENVKLNSIIDLFLKDFKNKAEPNLLINNPEEKKDGETTIFIYAKKKYEIFKNPINFKLFYEDKIIFKAYSKDHLKNILIELSNYYYFFVNNEIQNDINSVLSLKNTKEIQLYPFFINLFNNLNYTIELNNKDINIIQIKKELLEPLYLYIEKKEIIKKLENPIGYNGEFLDDKLIFIYNQERQKLINKLDQYAKRPFIIEPMKITGNDGVGKSLTLQFYSSIELEGYNKFYFNLKLFEKYGRIKYFYIEMIRGFLSKKENSIKEDMKNYIDCVNHMQKNKNINDNNFFNVLMELINYLKTHKNNNIIIIDQFKYEYISDENFEKFKSQLDKQKFRLIICCSLNDGKVKNKMFGEYENEMFWINDLSSFQEDISESKENEKNEIKIINSDNIEKTKDNQINLKNIFILKKRRAAEKLNEDVLCKKKKENSFQINITNKNNEDNDSNNSNNNIDYRNNEKSINNNNNTENKNEKSLIIEPKNIYNFKINFPQKKIIIPYDTTPVNIYYNNLIDLKYIINEESKEIYNFMSNFKYLPKYYKKFNIFRISQKINNINDDSLVIENFKKEISDKIRINIKNFYTKEYNNFNNSYNNIYNYILELKNKINKYNDKNISFKKLYKFSKKYPMKYIIVEPEDNSNNISFDDSIVNKIFKINFSFPFIEYVLNSIIEEYDNSNKIDINYLSGSAFGNALELKIIEYIKKFEEKIEIRKIWSLDPISKGVKESKINEIKNKTLNACRYQELEDILKINPLNDSNAFYFKPDNQDNYLIDSILMINHGNKKFSMSAFQITKKRDKNKIKSKDSFKNHLSKKVKTKFEKLYNIEIHSIYLWFILSNDHLDNNDTCKDLNTQNIKYVFYSIKENCLFEERNVHKIDNLVFFEKKEALIYSISGDYNCEYENNIKIEPLSISKFEDKLYNLSELNEIINYETVRKNFFRKNYGLKIGDKLRISINDTIKVSSRYENDFYLLFLFSFPFNDIAKYYNLEDELIFILKFNKKIYFCYKNNKPIFFEIDCKNNKLKGSKSFQINFEEMLDFKQDFKYNEEEIDISSIEELKDNSIIYLYKIYYIGELKDRESLI